MYHGDMQKPLVMGLLLSTSLRELEATYGISHRFSADRSKISLNYAQVLARPGDLVSGQCRGLIVRPHDSYDEDEIDIDRPVGFCDVIAWPMNRFYNQGDPAAWSLDWDDSSLTVFEKLDGTCTILYWDEVKHEWHVGTRAVPEADVPMDEDGLTFRQLFEKAATNTCGSFSSLVHKLPKQLTYVFELTAPQNRIHVKYDDPRLTLLAVRDLVTGLEVDCGYYAGLMNVPLCPTFKIHGLDDIVKLANSQPPDKMEGVVVMDNHFRRVKIKSLAYVLTSRMTDMLRTGSTDLIESILDESIDDIIPQVDADVAEKITKLQIGIRSYNDVIQRAYEDFSTQSGSDRRVFAELAKTSGLWTAPLFALNTGKARSFIDWAKSSPTKKSICRHIRDVILKD